MLNQWIWEQFCLGDVLSVRQKAFTTEARWSRNQRFCFKWQPLLFTSAGCHRHQKLFAEQSLLLFVKLDLAVQFNGWPTASPQVSCWTLPVCWTTPSGSMVSARSPPSSTATGASVPTRTGPTECSTTHPTRGTLPCESFRFRQSRKASSSGFSSATRTWSCGTLEWFCLSCWSRQSTWSEWLQTLSTGSTCSRQTSLHTRLFTSNQRIR